MRVGVMSDIHVHRHEQSEALTALVEHVRSTDLDLLICAGDLSHRTHEIFNFLASLTVDCPRCWLPGNHDIWLVAPDNDRDTPERRYREIFPERSQSIGWHYLPAGPLVLDGHDMAVVGTMGWYYGPGFSEWHDEYAESENDTLARRFSQDLAAQLAEVPARCQLIAVSHHVPDARLLANPDEGGLANTLLSEHLTPRAERVRLAVHGHKHHRYGPEMLDGIAVVAWPFGYPYQHERAEDGLRIVDLAT